jgi:hypothetical protein
MVPVIKWQDMRHLPACKWGPFVVVALVGLGIAESAWAQYAPSPYAQPPGYPPPAYGEPQLPRSPSLPPAGYAPPAELPYEAGEPIPVGYRLVDEPRRGLVLAGFIVAGIAYGIGIMAAVAADFKNSSAYMTIPIAGPWLTLGRRRYGDCSESSSANEGLHCIGDAIIVMGIIADGAVQVIGGSLLFAGYVARQTKLVRNDLAWSVGPRLVGSGYGFGARASF